jgi:hypothetical protein
MRKASRVLVAARLIPLNTARSVQVFIDLLASAISRALNNLIRRSNFTRDAQNHVLCKQVNSSAS